MGTLGSIGLLVHKHAQTLHALPARPRCRSTSLTTSGDVEKEKAERVLNFEFLAFDSLDCAPRPCSGLPSTSSGQSPSVARDKYAQDVVLSYEEMILR